MLHQARTQSFAPRRARDARTQDKMAYSMVPSAEQITLVSEFTDFREEQIIAKALQMKNLDVEAVTNEYFESPENVSGSLLRGFGWG